MKVKDRRTWILILLGLLRKPEEERPLIAACFTQPSLSPAHTLGDYILSLPPPLSPEAADRKTIYLSDHLSYLINTCVALTVKFYMPQK
jgi:hypothetical protein